MPSLHQRLQSELIGPEPECDLKCFACRQSGMIRSDEHTEWCPLSGYTEHKQATMKAIEAVISHIAADVEGLIPKEQLAAITTEYMELQRQYDENRLGWKTDDGSAEQDLLVRRGKLDQKLVNIWQAALARYMKGTE